ncbi:MAG: hypothetical protein WCE54_20665 [Ignavibacteriaceae bacterium]
MKKEILNEQFEQIKNDPVIFLNYLKANYPLFHNSNFFFRDLQYGLRKFLEKKGIVVSYPGSEELTKKLAVYLEEKEILVKISSSTWRVSYPEFVTQVPGDPL